MSYIGNIKLTQNHSSRTNSVLRAVSCSYPIDSSDSDICVLSLHTANTAAQLISYYYRRIYKQSEFKASISTNSR
jgi:hypothetical protein